MRWTDVFVMLSDLQPAQLALAEFMSRLSEEAYCAGWMAELEVALWDVVRGRRSQYGQITITEEQRETLRSLAEACGGWIVFDDDTEETWMPLSEWEQMQASRET